MEHHFDIEIATEYGILEAILLNHMHFWVTKNRANDKNYYDGYYWTYNSVKALNELFPYATTKKIRNALKHLEDEEIIITGNYNQSAHDRTLWYAITEKGEEVIQKGKCIFPKGQMEVAERANGSSQKGKPIPYNITDNNHISINRVPPTVEEIAEYCRERQNGISAQQFYDFYESKGWMVGKNKMKDWRACVRTWERRREEKTSKAHNFAERQTDYSEIEKLLFNQ